MMMSESVTLSRKEYETLVGYKQIVELEYERPLAKALLKKLENAQRDIQSGKGIVLHSKAEIQKYFESL